MEGFLTVNDWAGFQELCDLFVGMLISTRLQQLADLSLRE
jgi:hypothetical protein